MELTKRTGRDFWVNLSLALASLIVTLGISELIARALLPVSGHAEFVPDPVLGFRHASNQRVWVADEEGEFGLWFTTNSHGDADRERSMEKPSGAYRIAVIGDSMVEASQVVPEHRFTALLEEQLKSPNSARGSTRQVEVLNLGTASYGTAQEWLYYQSHVRRFAPDLVLLVFLPGNDIKDNSFQLEVVEASRPEIKPFFLLDSLGELSLKDRQFYANAVQRQAAAQRKQEWPSKLRNWHKEAQLPRLLRQTLSTFRAHSSSEANSGSELDPQTRVTLELFHSQTQDKDADWHQAWELTAAILKRFHEDVSRDGARFHVVVATGPWEIHDESRRLALGNSYAGRQYDWELPHRLSGKMLTELRLPYTSLLAAVQAGAQRTAAPMHFIRDGHYTSAGHEVVAAELLPVVRSYLYPQAGSQNP